MSFPAMLDNLPTSMQGTTDTALVPTVDHGLMHRELGTAVNAIELFLGTNSASSGVFANYTAGQTPLPINNGTLGTVINKGTLNNGVLGSATLNGGTANNQTLGTPTVQGAVINTANIIGSAVTNPMGTSATGLSQIGTTHDPTTTLITGGSFQMITTGNPVLLLANVNAAKNTNTGYMIVYLETNGTLGQYGNVGPGIANANYSIPIMSLVTLAAGTYTFALGGAVDAGTVTFNSYSLVAIELKR